MIKIHYFNKNYEKIYLLIFLTFQQLCSSDDIPNHETHIAFYEITHQLDPKALKVNGSFLNTERFEGDCNGKHVAFLFRRRSKKAKLITTKPIFSMNYSPKNAHDLYVRYLAQMKKPNPHKRRGKNV